MSFQGPGRCILLPSDRDARILCLMSILGPTSMVGHFFHVAVFQTSQSYYNLMQNNIKPIPPLEEMAYWGVFDCKRIAGPSWVVKLGSQRVSPRAHDWHFQRPLEPQSEPKSCRISSSVSGPLECPSMPRMCVPPTLGISCCRGDINKSGCALSSALKPLVFSCWLFTASSPRTSWEKRWRTSPRGAYSKS